LFASLEAVHVTHDVDSLISIRFGHGTESFALSWLGDGGIAEWEDVSTNGNGEKEKVAGSNGEEVVEWIITKSSASTFVKVAVTSIAIVASFIWVGLWVVVEPGDKLISGLSNRVSSNNRHHTEHKGKDEELGRLELVKSNTTLSLGNNTNFSLSDHVPDLTGKSERKDDDEHAPEHVDKCDEHVVESKVAVWSNFSISVLMSHTKGEVDWMVNGLDHNPGSRSQS